MKKMNPEELKREIFEKIESYYRIVHKPGQEEEFVPGESRVQYAGRVFDEKEMVNLVDASLDFWLTAGPYARKFEDRMRGYFDAKKFYLVNSGSSANLVMVSALTSDQLEEPLKPGDEVITPSVTFPTTLTPIVQNGLVPVFVDCELGTYNIDPNLMEEAVGPRTRAVLVPHTLGNPCNMEAIMELARRRSLIVLEDACDSLGATFDGKPVGAFGAMASLSFYPAHHITMGEGGGVVVNDPKFSKIALSIRDWGRECWCEPGQSGTCGRRFKGQFGNLPFGYDHKYVYSNFGYNLKATDMQAAVGLAQLDKIESFVEKRRDNFQRLYEGLRSLENELILPRMEPKAEPSPFAFPVTVRKGIKRIDLINHLETAKIETRLLFGGNIICQPGFMNMEHRVHGSLEISDRIMNDTLFVGVYPGLSEEKLDYITESFKSFFN